MDWIISCLFDHVIPQIPGVRFECSHFSFIVFCWILVIVYVVGYTGRLGALWMYGNLVVDVGISFFSVLFSLFPILFCGCLAFPSLFCCLFPYQLYAAICVCFMEYAMTFCYMITKNRRAKGKKGGYVLLIPVL